MAAARTARATQTADPRPLIPPAPSLRPETLWPEYQRVRRRTEALCAPLAVEDYVIQSMPDVSPPKWHLAHTTWFFEAFLLGVFLPDYRPFHPRYAELFNSYYQTLGTPYPRPRRGLLARPTVAEVYRYRSYVDERMQDLLGHLELGQPEEVTARATLGLHHEQQHQELLLTDIKHIFASNPLRPAYQALPPRPRRDPGPQGWVDHPGGVVDLGHAGAGFAFDNETPRHRCWLDPFCLASRPVSNGEYQAFMADGGYRRPEPWLSDGWTVVQQQGWSAPLYWVEEAGTWWQMTLGGLEPVDAGEPVCHVSYYEADAYARWAGQRLPGEAEWEASASGLGPAGHWADAGYLQPLAANPGPGLRQCYGDVWEWTRSAYGPYPGYRPPAGALGEYNGKFMCNQMVLRGGSCATPAGHIRPSYRNFFYPADRWQFSGIRLADTA